MDSEFFKKVFDLVFGRIGIGAIFLATTVAMWMQMQDMQKRSEERWSETLKSSEHRFEKMFEEERKDRHNVLEIMRICCREKGAQ